MISHLRFTSSSVALAFAIALSACGGSGNSGGTQNPPVILTSALPVGTVGVPYSASLSASGGTAPLTWSITSGNLPSGLTLSAASGVISGTPAALGKSSFMVTVSDAKSLTASASLSITIEGVVSITTLSLPGGTVGVPYSTTLAASGGLSPYTWSLTAGSLPVGLTLGVDGTIAGSPTVAGTANFTVQVADSEASPATATANLSLTIDAPHAFAIIHDFNFYVDAGGPRSGLTMEQAGNFYGTAVAPGIIYELTPSNGGWTYGIIYSFTGGNDGYWPTGTLTIGPDGSLYGTTEFGGGTGCSVHVGCGIVFRLQRSPKGDWAETMIYRFTGGADGSFPNGGLILDEAGNLYGTTQDGNGVVYELTPSNGEWTQTILYAFTGGNDGASPAGGLIFDGAGNLYGTTLFGGSSSSGTVFQLTPGVAGWKESVLHNFQGGSDGDQPWSSLIFYHTGNLYGTTSDGGTGAGGTVFELTPSNGDWTYTLLYGLPGFSLGGPHAELTIDAAGSLYGTTITGGAYLYGTVFKLTPSKAGWAYTPLHDFDGSGTDGNSPFSTVTFDKSGKLYGTTYNGGSGPCSAGGCGIVFQLTP